MNKELYDQKAVWKQDIQYGQKRLFSTIREYFPRNARTVLDAGCGDGKLWSFLPEKVNITGIDGSVEVALGGRSSSAKQVKGILESMPFASQSFDLVLCTDVLEHLEDDSEEEAWQEIFRVSRQYVMIAVPFQEYLLEGSARCDSCGRVFHLNWHQRPYSFDSFRDRVPIGWRVDCLVLTGEKWASTSVLDVWVRRHVLGEWAYWELARCPDCGGKPIRSGGAEMPMPLEQALAESLVGQKERSRNFTELLLLIRKDEAPAYPRPTGIRCAKAKPVNILDFGQVSPEEFLAPYPSVAAWCRADDDVVVQFPIARYQRAIVRLRQDANGPVYVRFEDGEGVLATLECLKESLCDPIEIAFPRLSAPGKYGVLARLPASHQIESIRMESVDPPSSVLDLSSRDAYFALGQKTPEVFAHGDRNLWIEADFLASGSREADIPEGLGKFIASLQELACHNQGRADALAVRVQNLEAEREALLRRAREADALAVRVQNLEAEREALLNAKILFRRVEDWLAY